MHSLSLILLLMFSTLPLNAADKQASFVFMPAYWYEYHWEETPDAVGRSSQRQTVLTAAYRLPFGLALGATWLKNATYAQDSQMVLTGQGLSLGYVGVEYISAFYTYLYNPRLDYDFPSVDASTSYYGGRGSIVDLGLHFGTSWLRFGPRVLWIDANYKQSSVTSGTETETSTLEGNPWKDRWLEPYIGVWLLF
ncbi:MAG TPA: hypothetical protein VE954_29260 [Oligoflexus sp.]|uniref:hypothetical protein n=1 Tax=Oligoflexus sp. TaxID=1971216 RepID=UPI002D757FC1|nr:hypothetical protein [Oligoflexus sp.]HYX37212.1 hypothetical protein [Oligoflexus sp.]